jgi:hypothetical protein
VTRSEPLAFRWRRTAFARIDGAVESVENDWSLFVDGLSAARIYRVRGGPERWAMVLDRPDWPRSRAVQHWTGHAGGGREACEAILRAMGDA